MSAPTKCKTCSRQDHSGVDCKDVNYCSKCDSVTDHKTASCSKRYPTFDKQCCDHCLMDHEAKKCKYQGKSVSGLHCKFCGHGDHDKKSCPFEKKWKSYEKVPDEDVNLFTKSFRELCLKKGKKPALQPKTSTASSSKTLADQDSKSLAVTATSPPQEEPLVRVGKMKVTMEVKNLWDQAEREMPSRMSADGYGSPRLQTKHVLGNFFKVTLDPDVKLYRYSITIGDMGRTVRKHPRTGAALPPKYSRETKEYLIRHLFEENPTSTPYVTDYDSIVISAGALYEGEPNGEKETPHKENVKGAEIMVASQITFVGLVDSKALNQHVSSSGKSSANIEPDLQALNIISWRNIRGVQFNGGRVGTKFYLNGNSESQERTEDMNTPFCIRQGFTSSMRPGSGSILLNVCTTTSAFLTPVMIDKWRKLLANHGSHQLGNCLKYLKYARVTFEGHEGDQKRIFSIYDMSDRSIDKMTFTKVNPKNGNKTLVYVYKHLKETYPYCDFNSMALAVNVGGKDNDVWFPADKLRLLDWQFVKAELPNDIAEKMVKRAELSPYANKTLIQNEALPHLDLKASYREFGITLDNKFVAINPKSQTAPRILHAGVNNPLKDGSWVLTNKKFHTTPTSPLSVLYVISMDETETKAAATERLRTNLYQHGVGSEKMRHIEVRAYVRSNSRSAYSIALTTALTQLTQKSGSTDVPIILVVVGEKREISVYAEVKRWGDAEVGIPTICVTRKKLDRCHFHNGKGGITGDFNLRANLCVKFNLKLSCVTHTLKSAQLIRGVSGTPFGSIKDTMVVGADCTHPGKDNGCPSIAGVVATTDDTSFQYLASARLQSSKQEFISDLRSMMKERYRAWYKRAEAEEKEEDARFPAHVLFYRDGVSESQYGMVLHEERIQIQQGCQDAYSAIKKDSTTTCPTTLTLIVVTKRHHARFFSQVEGVVDKRVANLPAGTTIDSVVVAPKFRNFYLQSHNSPLGTARSSHYIVLYDDLKDNGKDRPFTMQELEGITYNLCYSGARAVKSNSVCTPARYADFLCDRLRCYMKPALESRMTVTAAKGPDDDPNVDTSAAPEKWAENDTIWKSPMDDRPADRENPWHPSLDDVMFYL